MRGARTTLTGPETWLLVGSGLFVALLGALGIWWQDINRSPAVVIPTPVLPHPNAFDSYRDANALATGGRQLMDAVLSDGERNEYGRYTPQPYSLADKEEVLAANAAALTRLRQGLRQTYCEPPPRSNDMTPTYHRDFRRLGQLFRLDAQVKAAHCNAPGAVASCIDGIKFGQSLSRGAALAGFEAGIAVQSSARTDLWRLVHDLSAPQAQAATHRLQTALTVGVPFAEALQAEKRAGQAFLMDLFAHTGWRRELAGWTATGSSDWWLKARLLTTGKRAIMDSYGESIDQRIAAAHRPYAWAPHRRAGVAAATPSDPILTVLQLNSDSAQLHAANNDAQNALLLVSLALRADRARRGFYPATLDDLVPSFLSALPCDPFAAAGPLHYRRVGVTYTLYSVGPDGRDDGGRPISDFGPTPLLPGMPAQHYLVRAAEGDIIAGINTRCP